MFSYIRAEIYRTKFKSTNVSLVILGVLATALGVYSSKFLMFGMEPHNAGSFLNQMVDMIQQNIPLMAMLVAVSSFKRKSEIKNYISRGRSRQNIVFGDIVVSFVMTIVIGVILYLVSVLASKLLPDVETSRAMITNLEFLYTVFISVFIVMCLIIGLNMIYELSDNVGLTITFGFLLYYLIPIIIIISGAAFRTDFIGAIAKFLIKINPLNYFDSIKNLVLGGESIQIKDFLTMLIVNIPIFTGIRSYVISKKRY